MEFEDRLMTSSVGAAEVNVTVPVDVPPPTTVDGVNVTETGPGGPIVNIATSGVGPELAVIST